MSPISGSGIMGQSGPFDWAKFTRCEGFWSRHASRKGLDFCMISAAAGHIHNEKRTMTSVYWKKKKKRKRNWVKVKIRCNRCPCFPVSWCKMKPVCMLVVVVFFCKRTRRLHFFAKCTIRSDCNSTRWRYLVLVFKYDFLFSSSFILLQASTNGL